MRKEADIDVERAAAQAKAQETMRRTKAKQNQEFLKQQMLQRPKLGKFGAEQMTEAEKAFNRERLEWASAPEGLDTVYSVKQHQYKSSPQRPQLSQPTRERACSLAAF